MYGLIALKLIIGLIALMVIVRTLGKKEMAQITPLDFIYLLILGGILEESVYDDKVTIGHLIFALGIWALAILLFEWIMRKFEGIRVLVMGNPYPIIKDGELDIKAIEKSKLELEQLRTLLRQQGIFSFKEVQFAFLETSGDISVMRYPEFEPVTPQQLKVKVDPETPSVLLVDEGEIEEKGLRMIGKDEDWLRKNLKKEGYGPIEELYFVEWTEREGFNIQKYNEK
ncbi:DUF421 domain-containing protein [Niallia sp. XMNu-256]|uniref:DUF421 domain-containing protein n=1 Tax=Niallia sp. XMNu-256 TaxID=3082444 RepID=UPI0030CE0BC2